MSYFQEELDVIEKILSETNAYIRKMSRLRSQVTYSSAIETMDLFMDGMLKPFKKVLEETRSNAEMDVNFTEVADEDRHNSSPKAD